MGHQPVVAAFAFWLVPTTPGTLPRTCQQLGSTTLPCHGHSRLTTTVASPVLQQQLLDPLLRQSSPTH